VVRFPEGLRRTLTLVDTARYDSLRSDNIPGANDDTAADTTTEGVSHEA